MLEARSKAPSVPAHDPTVVAAVARILRGWGREVGRWRARRPFVTLSWAQSLDGCIARAPGQRTTISGDETLGLTHALRAAHDGILIGVGTLLADDPALTVRLWSGQSPRPIVLDSRLRTPIESKLVANGNGRAVSFCCTEAGAPERQQRLEAAGAVVLRLPGCTQGLVQLPALLDRLGQLGVQRLMVEGGARVLTSFLRAGLGDYAIVTVAPRMLGGLPAVHRGEAGELPQLVRPDYERFGVDMVMAGPLRAVSTET